MIPDGPKDRDTMRSSGGIINQGPTLGRLLVVTASLSVAVVLFVLMQVSANCRYWVMGSLLVAFVVGMVVALRHAVSPPDYRL